MKIRLSPSGPVVENSSGGPFEPGDGAMLRLSEGMTTIGGSLRILTTAQTIGTQLGGGTVLVATLANPKTNLRYRATVLLDVENTTTNSSADVQIFIDTSIDGGTTWVEEVANAHYVGAGSGVDGTIRTPRQVRCDMTLRLGSALLSTMTATSPSLKVRARIGQAADVPLCLVDSRLLSGTEDALVGTALLQLSEHF